MVIATAEGSRRTAVRREPDMRAGGRDRAREFRRARRHSVVVRALKIVLPLGAAGIVSMYVVPTLIPKEVDYGNGTASIKGISLDEGALKMLEPRVKGVNDKQERYEFVADTATQQAK